MKRSTRCAASGLLLFTGAVCYAENLALKATVEVTSMASERDGKYGLARALDGQAGTHWASAHKAPLPQTFTVSWPEPVRLDTVIMHGYWQALRTLYSPISSIRLTLDDGTVIDKDIAEEDSEFVLLRLDAPRQVRSAALSILAVHRTATYVGVKEIGFYLDPEKRLAPPRDIAKPVAESDLVAQGRPQYPCVFTTRDDLQRARRNAADTTWGKAEKERIIAAANEWLAQDAEYWTGFLPPPGACYAYGFTGCPVCGAGCGTWAGARCSWEHPRRVTCANGHVLPNDDCPDEGNGFQGEDGRFHYLLGTWNAWVTEQWTLNAIPNLAHAYALTGDEIYAERAALFLDLLASIYAESTSGSWDYPSRPPSGRFARPWYQVARTLVVFVEAYDLVYASAALDQPSLRPLLEQRVTDQAGTSQQRSVGTADATGWSRPGMTRRQNIDRNLVLDGGMYCYGHSFAGNLANGHADYLRGALAAGALLGIEPFVTNALDSPYSIYTMLTNNADRDGRYYETALGYALHARNLYLSFVQPLRNWRSDTHPNGVNLMDDARMRSFFYLPDSVMDCAGHAPNFGDSSPDTHYRIPDYPPASATDYRYAENLLATTTGEDKETFAAIAAYLAAGDLEKKRESAPFKRWLLYHADPAPDQVPPIPADLEKRLFASWLLGQKGIGILRDGRAETAQAALLRYGPSLNHGDKDDLGLLYYAKGRQMTYDIGYGLGSTHCQVGWASQTASHCLVAVDESSQSGASGGSAYLFADLPGIKVIEADSPLSYSKREVSLYRRTVALLGHGADHVLVDLFRVRGGSKHDYIIGVQSREWESSLEPGPEEDGSLAAEVAWGEQVGADGDIVGVPNKPYWNPPPGTGYGFFFDMRRTMAPDPFQVTFNLGGPNQARLRFHALPEADTEAVLAKAPGLYPRNTPATYLLLRRQAATAGAAASDFACVMEPFDTPLRHGQLTAARLPEYLAEANAETKRLDTLGVLLLKGAAAGDFMEFAIPVEQDGNYRITAAILGAPSYGTVALSVNGAPQGEPFNASRTAIGGPIRADFGTRNLEAGTHRVRLTMQQGQRFFVGLAALGICPAGQAPEQVPEAEPVLKQVHRFPVTGGDSAFAGLCVAIERHDGQTHYLLSGDRDSRHTYRVTTPHGEITWQGGVALLTFRNADLQVATHGAWNLRLDDAPLPGPAVGVVNAAVIAVNEAQHWVELEGIIEPDMLGECIYFRNPRYSRDTAYRIYGLSTTPEGRTRIDLGSQSTVLGKGRVLQLSAANVITSDIPHDYARSVIGGANTRFFDGKRITGEAGAESLIQEMLYQKPLKITVDDAGGFADGEIILYHDIAVGDQALIPTAWFSQAPTPR